MYLTSKSNRLVYLNPGVLVVCRRGPSINKSLVIQSGQFGPPSLQSQNAIVHRRSRNMSLGDASSFHSQQRDTSWEAEPDISRYSSTQETNRLTVRQTDGYTVRWSHSQERRSHCVLNEVTKCKAKYVEEKKLKTVDSGRVYWQCPTYADCSAFPHKVRDIYRWNRHQDRDRCLRSDRTGQHSHSHLQES